MSFHPISHMNDSLVVTPYQNPQQNQAIVAYNQDDPSDEVMQIMKRVLSVTIKNRFGTEPNLQLCFLSDTICDN